MTGLNMFELLFRDLKREGLKRMFKECSSRAGVYIMIKDEMVYHCGSPLLMQIDCIKRQHINDDKHFNAHATNDDKTALFLGGAKVDCERQYMFTKISVSARRAEEAPPFRTPRQEEKDQRKDVTIMLQMYCSNPKKIDKKTLD